MKYFISCKQKGLDSETLTYELSFISDLIEKTWNTTFVYFRDIQKWWEISIPNKEIMKIAFDEINKSDALFVFVNHEEKSEWMLLECWYAKAKWKKIVLAIKKWIDSKLLESLSDKIIEFDDLNDLKEKIKTNL